MLNHWRDVTALENNAWTYSWIRPMLDSSGLRNRSTGINSYTQRHTLSPQVKVKVKVLYSC